MTERNESIGAKVTEESKQRIRVAAAKRGMTMSEYIRTAVLKQVEEDEASEGNPKPVAHAAD